MSNLVNHARFIQAMDDPDIEYLKQDKIGDVVAEGLTALYQATPQNPLHFLGNWLVNYAATQAKQEELREQGTNREKLREKHRQQLESVAEAEKILREKAEQSEKVEQSFKNEIEASQDVDDLLDKFSRYLADRTEATGVYIGLYERVKKPVTDLDSDTAHIDDSLPFVIRHIVSSQEWMVNEVLKEEEGEVTYSVWKEEEKGDEEKSENEGEVVEKLKISYAPDVVNDPRIKYFDVPKLGCYLAVPLTYKSCLFESAFDTAVEDALECRRQRAEREAKIGEESDSKKNDDRQDEPLPEIKEAPYSTQEIKLVVCSDTLGQDREFSPGQIEHVCDWVKFFRDQWERAEADCMRHDVMTHIQQHDLDLQKINDKEADWAEDERAAVEEPARDLELSEEAKTLEGQIGLVKVLRERLLESENIEQLMGLKTFKIVKYAQLFLVAFYLFGVPKDQVVEENTNKIHWKKAKLQLNASFENHLQTLNPCGAKPDPVPVYAKTTKLQKDLAQISYDEVRNYSLAMGHLYRWLENILKLRVMDVTHRRKEYMNRKEEKEAAEKAAEELAEKRRRAIEEAKEKHENDMQQVEEDEREEFDEEKFCNDFDERESNQPVEIPETVQPDVDSDLDWEETAE